MFALYNFIILFIFAILANYISNFFAIILGLYFIFTFLPNLAVNARRLHDINLSGWWQLIGLIPYVYIVLIILFCLKGNDNANRFGLNPLQEIE
ncbi:DUF805 domain-containing protein [Campylobacter sp. 2018MI35]|uniref:DUF805 domain-containing protein n=1 Tax=Campylobacter sp. 2018MI34 TaxID=2800582 RepID=UPI0019051F99|nr:DUF805 domain-containing protein [Campylobacter sp. 2018MI34]MBK1991409.1 DUF805 domain-containing protein [Campylobacter sp. 2018MI34]